MSSIRIGLLGEGRCRIVHAASGAEIRSSKSPDFGGTGDAFSSTDLLAAALGSCIATSMEPVAERHGVPLETLRLTVEKALSLDPKRIASLAVAIHLPPDVPDPVTTRLRRAADACTVHKSLSREVEVKIEMHTGEGREEEEGRL